MTVLIADHFLYMSKQGKGLIRERLNDFTSVANCSGFPAEVCTFPNTIYNLFERACARGETWRNGTCTTASDSWSNSEYTPSTSPGGVPCALGYEYNVAGNGSCWLRPYHRAVSLDGCGTTNQETCGIGWLPW